MQFFHRIFPRCTIVTVLLAASSLAGAVELGDVQMRSHIGQPLSADIELLGAASDSVPVQAGVADADVYRGASISMHPALATANITTFRRDGRRYLHISSSTPMKADHLPIFFTLSENGQKSVRQVTLWLTPDPNPAPPPAPPPPVAVAPAVLATAAPAAPAPVAAPSPPAVPAALPKTVMPREVPALAFIPAAAAVRHAVTLPRATPARACSAAREDADSCTALDVKNAALTAHLTELEDKIKQLSTALQAGAVAAMPAATAAVPHLPAAAIKPVPAKLVPMGSKPVAPAGRPWLVIGIVAAIVLTLVAALLAVLLRRRRNAKLKSAASEPAAADASAEIAPPKPSFIASVKNRLMPGRAGAAKSVEAGNTAPAM